MAQTTPSGLRTVNPIRLSLPGVEPNGTAWPVIRTASSAQMFSVEAALVISPAASIRVMPTSAISRDSRSSRCSSTSSAARRSVLARR